MQNTDTRCCGTGTCVINADGMCWCGQRWDGEEMRQPTLQCEQARPTPAAFGDRQEKRSPSEDGCFDNGSAE